MEYGKTDAEKIGRTVKINVKCRKPEYPNKGTKSPKNKWKRSPYKEEAGERKRKWRGTRTRTSSK
jgi:hypothetical protein